MSDAMSSDALADKVLELSEGGGSAADWTALLSEAKTAAPDKLGEWIATAQETLAKLEDTAGGIDLLQWRADNVPSAQMTPKDWLRAADVVAGSNPQLLAILLAAGFGGRLAPRECIRRFRLLFALSKPGTLCLHRTWGFGTIAEFNHVMKTIKVDFAPPRSIPLAVAAESMEVLGKDHILARFHANKSEIRALAKSSPADLVREALKSFGPISAAELQNRLVRAEIVLEPEWKDFWKAAAKELKKDPSIDVPSKKTEPIRLRDAVSGYDDAWYAKLAKERDLKSVLNLLRELARNLPSVDAIPAKQRAILADRLSFVLRGATKKQPAMKMSAALLARHFRMSESECPWQAAAAAFFPSDVFLELVHDLSSRDIPSTVECLSALDPEKTRALLFEHLFHYHSTALNEIMNVLLKDKDSADEVRRQVLARCNSLRVPIEMLLWILKNGKKCAGWNLPSLSRLAPVIVSELELDYSGDRLRTRKLLRDEFDDEQNIQAIFNGMSPDKQKDFFRQMCRSSVWTGSDRQVMQTRVLRSFPDLESVIAADSKSSAPQRIFTSARSYREHQALLERIVNHDIPENSREIEKARAYGDLSENYEYKAAKERQRTLGAQRDKLAKELNKYHPTDFAEFSQGPKTAAGIGSSVCVAWPDGRETVYHILGEWDQIPEKNFISVTTPVGQALNGKAAGDTVEMPNGDGPDLLCIVKSISPLSQEILDWVK